MSKASGSIDLKSLKIAGEPNKYITKITSGDGITIHDSQNQNINFIQLTSEGLDIYKEEASSSNKVAHFGSSAIIGMADMEKAHTIIESNRIAMITDSGATALSISGSGNVETLTKTVTLNQHILKPNSWSFSLPSISNGTRVTWLVELKGYSEYQETVPITIGTSSSGSYSSGVIFSYQYTSTNNSITFTAGGDDITIVRYQYTTSIISPLIEMTGRIDIDGTLRLKNGLTQIYNAESSSLNNTYYKTDGYHAFYATDTAGVTSTGSFYVYGDHLMSTVPFSIKVNGAYYNVQGFTEGTKSGWHYRKWSGGKIEAWYSGSITASATETSGGVYRSTYSISIPSEAGFTSAPNILVSINQNAATVFAINGNASSKTAISGRIFRTGASTSTYSLDISIYAWQN